MTSGLVLGAKGHMYTMFPRLSTETVTLNTLLAYLGFQSRSNKAPPIDATGILLMNHVMRYGKFGL